MRNLKLIIIREYLARVRNKTFVIMTFLSPIIMVAMILLIAYLSSLNNNEKDIVAIHDQNGAFINLFHSNKDVEFKNFSDLPLAKAIDSTQKQEFTGLLFIPKNTNTDYLKDHIQFFSNNSPNTALISSIEQKISKTLTDRQLTKNNIDVAIIKAAQTQVALQVESFSGQQTSKMAGYVKMIFGGAAGYLLMMFIIIYGNMVMRSVIEEKTNRIVEIIISSVKPIHLMMGKILGTTLAGITQFLIWIFFGAILLFIASGFFGVDIMAMQQMTPAAGIDTTSTTFVQNLLVDIASLPLLELVFCFLIYFIGGYFLYSAIYASIGAAVDNETDTQQFIFPIILPLMLGIYVGFFAVIGNPHGVVATVFSYIPLTSPIVMLMRIPFGVAWWEVLISILILVGSVFGVTWIGAKIYRVGILMYGKKPSYKEIGKWLKY